MKIKNILLIEARRWGVPAMSFIADKCPNLNIYVVDIDIEKINYLNNNH